MKVYIPLYANGKRTYEEIETTTANYEHWQFGNKTIFSNGICYPGYAIYATPDDALTHGWSSERDHYTFMLEPRDLVWLNYADARTGEIRVKNRRVH